MEKNILYTVNFKHCNSVLRVLMSLKLIHYIAQIQNVFIILKYKRYKIPGLNKLLQNWDPNKTRNTFFAFQIDLIVLNVQCCYLLCLLNNYIEKGSVVLEHIENALNSQHIECEHVTEFCDHQQTCKN